MFKTKKNIKTKPQEQNNIEPNNIPDVEEVTNEDLDSISGGMVYFRPSHKATGWKSRDF
jgi:hypothetical protein